MRDAKTLIVCITSIVVLVMMSSSLPFDADLIAAVSGVGEVSFTIEPAMYLGAMIAAACVGIILLRNFVRRMEQECAESDVKYIEAYCPECGSHLCESEEFCMRCGNSLKIRRSTPIHFADRVY